MKYHPFAYWLFALIIGIGVIQQWNLAFQWILGILIFSAIVFLIFTVTKPNRIFLFLSGFICVVSIGAMRFHQFNSNISTDFLLSEQKEVFYLQIEEQVKPSEKYNKYYAKILSTENTNDSVLIGKKVLVYIKNQSNAVHIKDRFWVYGKLGFIPSRQNPHAFDYQTYMRTKRISLQIFSDSLASLEHGEKHSLAHQLSVFKQNIKTELDQKGFSKTSKIFISSLALGDRSDLDKEFQEKLSSAGVMHLFAISGLHVGIVFGAILLLLYPILYLRQGKIIRWLIALILIWIFAWFVGFTPSVTRAAFMISFYYITLILQRNSNIYHTLAFSAFILLLIRPNQLFDVGFQLSYSAVFFIAWLFKPVRNLLPHYRKPYKNYIFDLLTITTVAQIGVMPISVFYFNKFSGLFLFGNMVVLPFASIMVILSFLTVITLSLDIFPLFLVNIINYAFEKVYHYIDFLTSFDSLVLRDITWNWVQVILLISMLLLLKTIIQSFKWQKLIPLFSVLILFQFTRVYANYEYNLKKQFIVFHQYKGSIIAIRHGKQLDIFWQVDDSANARNYTLNPYALKEKIKEINIYELMASNEKEHYIKKENIININGETYFISTKELVNFPETDVVILTQSPLKLPDEIPAKIKRIIADGSNYPSNIVRLKEISDKIYSTHENGAYLEPIQ